MSGATATADHTTANAAMSPPRASRRFTRARPIIASNVVHATAYAPNSANVIAHASASPTGLDVAAVTVAQTKSTSSVATTNAASTAAPSPSSARAG